jgi:hypothetical protein
VLEAVDKISMAVVTAIMRMCYMYMQRAFESPPTQLTVNQAAGVAGNAAAAAAVQLEAVAYTSQSRSVKVSAVLLGL